MQSRPFLTGENGGTKLSGANSINKGWDMTDYAMEPLVRNAWYIAAWADEIDDGHLVARRIFGEDVVLFRG